MLRSSVLRFRFSRESLGLVVFSLVIYGSLVALMALRMQATPFPWTMRRWVECSLCLAVGGFLSLGLARRLNAERKRGRRPGRGDRGLQRQFVALAQGSLDAVFVLDPRRGPAGAIEDFELRFLNEKALAILGKDAGRAVGERVQAMMPFLAAEGYLEQFREVIASGKGLTAELAVRDELVGASWIRLSAMPFEHGLLLTVADLTEQKELETQLCQGAQRDKLTGLPNRALLDDRIQQALERAKRSRGSAAVMMLDIDGLRGINETHGEVAGDQVLKVVAARLRRAVRATDSVFRLGGDKFVVLFGDIASDGPVKDFARKIVVSLLPPIAWKGANLHVSASVGVAMYPVAGTTPETLLVEADIDMRRAKRCQRAQVEMETRVEGMELRRFSLMMGQ